MLYFNIVSISNDEPSDSDHFTLQELRLMLTQDIIQNIETVYFSGFCKQQYKIYDL